MDGWIPSRRFKMMFAKRCSVHVQMRNRACKFIFGAIALVMLLTLELRAVMIERGVTLVGTLEHPALSESSGLTASPTREGVFYTHNDTGNPAFLFAIDRNGRSIGAYEVKGARLIDW